MNRRSAFLPVGAAAVLLLLAVLSALRTAAPTAAAGPFPVTTIFTNLPGHPSADVPGFPGVHFEPGTGISHFDRVFGSPGGNWILTAQTDRPDGSDELVLVNGQVKLFQGDAAPWTTGENVGPLDTRLSINDSGQWVLATNTDGPPEADEVVVTVSAAGVYTVVAREGDPVPVLPGADWGLVLESAVLAADGRAGLVSDALVGPPVSQDEILVLGDALLAQEGVTVPQGQVGSEPWENFDLEDIWLSADASSYLVQGDLAGDMNTDDVVVVNGAVVVQEGTILSGTTFVDPVDASGIVGVHMAPDGAWFVRGNNDVTEQDWIYSQGVVLAATGDPIYAGAAQVFTDTEFADTFFLHVGDAQGHYVIGGVSDGPTLSNGVLVADSRAVIAREGDQLDLDNDGALDDAYFDTFGNDDAFLADDGTFYLVATIKDAAHTRLGQGLFSIDIGALYAGNISPTLSGLALTSPINENDVATLTGAINDPNPLDTFTLVTDWGDGQVATYTYPAATSAFTETHRYLDDTPSGTPADLFTVALRLVDSQGGQDDGVAALTVQNVAPVVQAGPDQNLDPGATAHFAGAFTDAGPLDDHTISWEMGDGSVIFGTLTPTYTYPITGTFTVSLTVTDDDGGVGTDALRVTVGGAGAQLYLPVVIRRP